MSRFWLQSSLLIAALAMVTSVGYGAPPEGWDDETGFDDVIVAYSGRPNIPEVILNEWSCVADGNEMDGSDTWFGTVEGNGGNWLELAVNSTSDVRDWCIEWRNADGSNNIGWIQFRGSAWDTNVPAQTLVTILEPDTGLYQGEYDSDDDFFRETHMDADGDTSTSGNWIHLAIDDDTKIEHGPLGFKIDNDNWKARILKPLGTTPETYVVIQDWVGENINGFSTNWGNGSIANEEVGKLQNDPGSVDWDGPLVDYDDADNSTFGGLNTWSGGGASQSW